MSTACITSATATTTSLLTTDVVSTSFSTSVSTEPATTTTITTEVCPLSISGLECIPTPSIFTSTIPGNLTTVSVPFTTTISSVETETLTLFATSCSVITSAGSNSNSNSTSSSLRSPGSGSGSGSGSYSASVSTPPPVTFTSQVPTTLQNGEVSAVVETFTTQPPPTTVYGPGPSGQVAQTNDDGSTKMAPILGAVVGGFFGLLGIALIIWFIMKRRRRWDDIFDPEGPPHSPGRRPTKRWSLDADMEPKPYQYGLVGQSSSPSLPTLGISQPESPPASSPSSQLRASPSSQLPRPDHHTLTPLLLPTSASTPGPSATTLSSRPSTAGSMRPLRDLAPSSTAASTGSNSHKQSASSGSSTSVQPHVTPSMPSHWGHHSPSPSTDQMQMHFDFENERSGSPTSMREWEPQRRLQLANVGDDDSITSPASASILDGKGPRQGHGRVGSTLSGILVDAGPAPSDSGP